MKVAINWLLTRGQEGGPKNRHRRAGKCSERTFIMKTVMTAEVYKHKNTRRSEQKEMAKVKVKETDGRSKAGKINKLE